jgi:hypothetical protein
MDLGETGIFSLSCKVLEEGLSALAAVQPTACKLPVAVTLKRHSRGAHYLQWAVRV